MGDLTDVKDIQDRILTIRGVQVMIDRDLAEMYGVETKNLNRAVSRNIDRFPSRFRFQLTQKEFDEYAKSLRFHFGTLKKSRGQHRKYLPYAFTEPGVSMLSAVLKSKTAVKISVQIIDAFVEMRRFLSQNASLFQRVSSIENKQIETDNKINDILTAIESKDITPQQGIFFDGQVFDAYLFVSDLIKSAKKSILLIDNYVDESVLQLFTKRKRGVTVYIYTKNVSKIMKQDLEKYNQQYPKVEIREFKKAHDRFLIIDNNTVYHIGASLKDVGKKWFAFSKMEIKALELMIKLPTAR